TGRCRCGSPFIRGDGGARERQRDKQYLIRIEAKVQATGFLEAPHKQSGSRAQQYAERCMNYQKCGAETPVRKATATAATLKRWKNVNARRAKCGRHSREQRGKQDSCKGDQRDPTVQEAVGPYHLREQYGAYYRSTPVGNEQCQ